MRADKFVHEHLDYIDGRIKLASCKKDIVSADCEQQNKITRTYSSANSAKMEQTEECLDNCIHTDAINCDTSKDILVESINKGNIATDTSDKEAQLNYNICENWRGLLRQSPQEESSALKKRRKPSYLDKCPEWDYIKLARNHNIPLMRNGSICKSVTIDGKVITITQTCAFDAILHLIVSGIANIKCYENKIKVSENRTIKLTMSVLHSGKITGIHYNERAKILIDLPLFREAVSRYTSNISKLNANCNVAHLITYLFSDIPSCRATTICSCGFLRRRQITELSINIDILIYKGLQYMQEAIDKAFATTIKCRKCLANGTEIVEYGPHLFIDTSTFTDYRYTKPKKTSIHSIEDIATNIQLNLKTYILVGVVNYINLSGGSAESGHYVTYAKYGNHWYEYDDTKKKRNVVAKTTITPHLICYVSAET